MKQKQPSKQSGFTLIEVMVVIVILGVLAALIVPNVMGRGEKAKVDTTVITLKGVAGALDQYKLDNQKYPSMQDGGLDALVNQPASAKNWLPGGYVKGGYPKDSWDNDIQYVIPGSEGRPFDLYSFGADGKVYTQLTSENLELKKPCTIRFVSKTKEFRDIKIYPKTGYIEKIN